MIHLPRVFLNSLLAVLFLLLYGCLQVPAPAAMDTPAPTATATIPPLTPSGPETTPMAPAIYPASFTVETANASIARLSEAPSSITGIGEVQAIIKKHTELANAKGLIFDHMEVRYSAVDQRWFLYPADGNGNIVGWLYIADTSSQTGWRPAELPTWDSQFAPSTDQYKYDLPQLASGDHWAVGVQNGYPILIEVDSAGNPLRWLDVANKQMDEVQGAVIHAEVNPGTSATLWPAEVQARFAAVLTDPWTATAEQKAAFDTYLATQWQLTLKDAGVANAETLQGYDLLNAIIEHQLAITLTGSETPEQLASYVVELPFSLHKLLRTDQDNLVGIHHEDGRYVEGQIDPRSGVAGYAPEAYRGPLQKSENDWGYYYAYYGLGGTSSPKPDHALLVEGANMWSNPPNAGFEFYGEKITAATDLYSIEGDAMFLFRIPGTDPNTAAGVMVRMYDGSQTRYAEAFLPFSTMATTQRDVCLMPVLGPMTIISCQEGLSIQPTLIRDAFIGTPTRGTLSDVLKLMSLYKNPHVTLIPDGGNIFLWGWRDGIPIVKGIYTPNLPKDFFNN